MPLRHRRSAPTIAFFPGAFRPPHAAHFAAVRYLAEHADIDEVVVVVANRSRALPGTPYGLAPALSLRVWQLYLAALPQVRVEVASGSAVAHALAYLQRAQPGQRLLYAIGEADLAKGDPRFGRLTEMAGQIGVSAETVALPTAGMRVRATAVREALVRGEAGRDDFIAALPTHLDAAAQERVWRWCREARQPIGELTRERLEPLLREAGVPVAKLESVRPGKGVDPVYRIHRHAEPALIAKYAQDTVREATLCRPGTPKPRQRLSVERRALNWLRGEAPALALPRVHHHDKRRKLLVLSELLPAGRSLAEQLGAGEFEPQWAGEIGDWLARCHWSPRPPKPLWGSIEQEHRHWSLMQARRLARIDARLGGATLHRHLEALLARSSAAAKSGLCHLNLEAEHLRRWRGQWGIVDWELAGGYGDPAYDLGTLAGHYLFWGVCRDRRSEAQAAIDRLLESYRRVLGAHCEALQARAWGYAGLGVLVQLSAGVERVRTALRQELVALAQHCVLAPPAPAEPAEVCRAVPGTRLCRA